MNPSDKEEQLRNLQVWNADSISELASLSRLRGWTFSPRSTFEAGGVSALARLPILQWLAFQESEVEGGNMRALVDLASVRRLDLKRCRFDGEDFIWLCEQWASGACPKLQEVWLEGTSISDEELQALGKIERLRWVILSDTSVSDAGLDHLHRLKKLETLWLHNTQVSEAGVMRLAGLPQLSIVVLGEREDSEQIREKLFLAQVALKKSKKPLDRAQLDAADARLRAFLGEMEGWERAAHQRAGEIQKRHKAERPLPNQMADAEANEYTKFWRDINVQKAAIAERFCSQKLLGRGAGRAGSYGNPPQFERAQGWTDFETPSAKKTIFYGEGRSSLNNKRRYILIFEDDEWKLDEVQWWSGGWKRDIV